MITSIISQTQSLQFVKDGKVRYCWLWGKDMWPANSAIFAYVRISIVILLPEFEQERRGVSGLRKLSVLIAEDEALVRQGIVALIDDEVGDITECSDGEDAAELLKNGKFDLALLDIGLPRRTGIDILTEVRRRQIETKVIILTGDTNSYAPTAIYEAGADAFLYKTAEADNFLEVFHAVANGRSVLNKSPDEGSNAKSVAELRDRLTPRELQIVKLIVEGSSNREVASSLFISEHTVRKHREHINQKLDVHSPASLAAFAIKASLV